MKFIKRFCICIVAMLAIVLSGTVAAIPYSAGQTCLVSFDAGEPGEEIEIVEDTVITAQWTEVEVQIPVGWVYADGVWHFYEKDGTLRINSWAVDSKGWCWLDKNGRIVKDKWIQYSGDWYYLKPNGYMAAREWAKDTKGWCWLSGSGRMVKDKWLEYKNAWYYLKPNGRMAASEWAKDTKGWCWLLPSGKAAGSRWILDGKEWYYLKSDLHMAANMWVADKSGNCYLGASGKIVYMTNKSAGAIVYKPAPNRQNGKLIVLDPGHSRVLPKGTEPVGPGSSTMKAKTSSGTQGVSTGINEYEMNMTISRALRTELLSRGYMVALTHETNDQAISNIERTQIANKLKANAYLRIHCNSVDSSSKRGAMAVTITSSNPWKKSMYSTCSKLAECVLSEYCKKTGLARDGIWYTDSMTGNNWADVPCILFEMGYMSNSTEDRWMANASNQSLMVKGLANGIDKFFK